MGIYSITDSAMAGLNIAQAGIMTTSQNVAGTTVEGYSRRNANVIMDSLAPNSLMLNGSSFAVEGFTRHYSSLIGSQLLTQQSKSSYSDTLVQYTNSIDSLVADKSTGLNTAISRFFNAMGAYAADPTNKAMAGAITGTAKEVEQRMIGMSTLVNQIQSDARSALTDTISQVNTILPALAGINQKIVNGNSPGVSAPSADLLDERDRLLSQLQKLVGGQSLINSDGTATQLVSGMPLVERAIANKVTINADQKHVALTFNLQNGPNSGVLTTVQSLDGGQAGALLELSNNFVPTVQKRLDTIAMGLVKVANSAAQTSSGTATNLAIFGFKVADKTYSSLASNDLTGQLPTIANENDLLDLYSSLGNAIASDSAVKVGNRVGTYTSISSITASSSTLAGDYTLTKEGTNQLKISDAFGKSQTVSLAASVSGGLQTVDFNQLGVTLQLENFSPALSALSSLSGTTSSVNTTNGNSGPANETAAITIGAGGLAAGQSLTIAGLKFTATTTVTQVQLGAAFENLVSGAVGASAANAVATALLGTYTGTLTGFNTGALSVSNVITATSITANQNVDNLAIIVDGSGGGVVSSVQITNGSSIPAATETAEITIGAVGLTSGQSLTIAGLKFTATTTVTQAQLGAAFANLTSGATGASAANAVATALLGTYTGTLTGFNTGALSASNVITATSTTPNSDASDISVITQAFSVGIKDNLSLPIGGPASQRISNLVIQNNVQAAELNFTSNGDKLTLTSVNGGSQTITVLPGAAAGQSFNFDQMGISFSVTDISSPIKTAAEIASYFGSIRVSSGDIKSGTTLPANLPTQSISNMVVQGSVKAGTYTFSATGANLTLSNGSGSSQTITVLPGASGGQTFNFNELGISFLVSDASSPAQTAATIAGYFDTKKLQVSAGITLEKAEDSQATIATALNGLKIKVSGMSNPLVNYGLNAANFVSLAPSNFASYFNGSTPLISSVKANAAQQMSAVFGTSISNLVNEVGVQVAIWKNSQKADTVVLANLKAQRDSVSGVNLDEEAANLLRYQQLYTASTKVLQAGNQMFSTLLSIMN
jgi:flagellar hook-associated protein FlgK